MTNQIKKTINDNLGKVTDTLVTPVNQRLSNPLIGSFALSWAILNWQPIIFLLVSNKNIEDKFSYIKEHFYGVEWSGWLSWCMYLIFPLLISILYAIGLPRLENLLEALNLKPRENKMSRVHTLNMKEYSHRIAYAKSQAEIENVKANYMEVEDLNQRITLLTEQLQERNKTIEDYKVQLAEIRFAYKEDINELSTTKEKFEIASRNLSNIITDLKDVLIDNYANRGLLSEEQHNLVAQVVNIPSMPQELKNYLSDTLNLKRFKKQSESTFFVTLTPSHKFSSLQMINAVKDLLSGLGIGYDFQKTNDDKTVSLDVFAGKNLTHETLSNILMSLPEVDNIVYG